MKRVWGVAGLLLASISVGAHAQGMAADTTARGEASGSIGDLRAEMTQRYDAALAASRRPDIVAADDSRFLWSSEAKVACGIAIGYLKNRIDDAYWIGRCRTFTDRMNAVPEPQPPMPPQPPVDPRAPDRIPTANDPATTCTGNLPVAVFFDWASAEPLPDSAGIIGQVVGSARACGWTALRLVGHADRSGTDDFNLALSQRRADAVAAAFAAAGFPQAALTTDAVGESDLAIATADGVREPKNRRVAIDLPRPQGSGETPR